MISGSSLSSGQPPANADPAGPLSADQLQQIAGARESVKRVMGAVKIAAFNFWCFAIPAAVCLLAGFFFLSSLVAAACLALLAYNERKGGRLIRGLEARGGLLLFYNQLGCLILIVLYCSWRIMECYTGPAPFDDLARSDPVVSELLSGSAISDLGQDAGELNRLYRSYFTFFYASIMALSAVFQGLCAWTYFRAYRLLGEFLRRTPPWVLAVLKAAS